MKKKDFEDLVESIKEMKAVMAGKMKPARVTKVNDIKIKSIRAKMKQSQTEFAYMIGVSPSTLRNWEQGTRRPMGPARALLIVAEKNPEAVLKALHL